MVLRYKLPLMLAAAATLAAAAPAVARAPSSDAALVQLVHDMVEAERQFDQPRLAAMTTGDYAEISPLGDVDLRAAFLGFYAADKKQVAPPITLGEPLVRRWGDTASVIVKLSIERPAANGQAAQAMAVQVGFLAVQSAGKWKIASAQYTPVRKPAPAKP